MPDDIPVTIEAGTLAPPACYSTEQERYEAYITATTAFIPGTNLQWVVSASTPAPADQGKAWLKVDVNGYPKEILLWVTALGTWRRIFTVPHYPVSTGGVANALTVTFNPTFLELQAGERIWFIASVANTAACTLAVDSLPVAAIKKKVSVDLAAGEILAGQVVEVIWDGTNYQMVSSSSELSIDAADIAPGTDAQTMRTRLEGVGPALVSKWETSDYNTPSSDQRALPSAGNVVTFLHGLMLDGNPATPVAFLVRLICTDAGGDAGYLFGDLVDWNLCYYSTDDNEGSVTSRCSDTYIKAVRPNNFAALLIPSGSGGASNITLTENKWRLIAWAKI